MAAASPILTCTNCPGLKMSSRGLSSLLIYIASMQEYVDHLQGFLLADPQTTEDLDAKIKVITDSRSCPDASLHGSTSSWSVVVDPSKPCAESASQDPLS